MGYIFLFAKKSVNWLSVKKLSAVILTKKRMKVAQMIEQQTLAVHSLFYQGKRYSKEELEEILAAYYKRKNKARA